MYYRLVLEGTNPRAFLTDLTMPNPDMWSYSSKPSDAIVLTLLADAMHYQRRIHNADNKFRITIEKHTTSHNSWNAIPEHNIDYLTNEMIEL